MLRRRKPAARWPEECPADALEGELNWFWLDDRHDISNLSQATPRRPSARRGVVVDGASTPHAGICTSSSFWPGLSQRQERR